MAKKYTERELEQIDQKFWALIDDSAQWQVLVVEASPSFRKNIANALRKAGADEVIEAADGREGLMAVRNLKNRVAVIIELNAAALNGIRFTQQFHALPQFAECPVIITSPEARKEAIVAAVRAGAAGYVKKPFQAQALIDKLKSLNVL